jgi:hypothetical protein
MMMMMMMVVGLNLTLNIHLTVLIQKDLYLCFKQIHATL